MLKVPPSLSFIAVGLAAAIALPLAAGAAPKAEAPKSDPVVAVVNKTKITRSDLEGLKDVMAAQLPELKALPLDAIYRELLDNLVMQLVLTQKAQQAKLQNDPVVKWKLTLAERDVLAGAWVQREAGKKVKDSDLKARYDERIKTFVPEEEVRARHILVDTEEKAKDLLKKLEAGESFETLAAAHSSDATAPRGGDLGFFNKAAMVPAFSEAAFALEPGKVSKKPVQTTFGWHLIKTEERRMSKPPAFEDVKESLKAEQTQELARDVIDAAMKGASVTLFNLDGSPLSDAKTTSAPPGADKN